MKRYLLAVVFLLVALPAAAQWTSPSTVIVGGTGYRISANSLGVSVTALHGGGPPPVEILDPVYGRVLLYAPVAGFQSWLVYYADRSPVVTMGIADVPLDECRSPASRKIAELTHKDVCREMVNTFNGERVDLKDLPFTGYSASGLPAHFNYSTLPYPIETYRALFPSEFPKPSKK